VTCSIRKNIKQKGAKMQSEDLIPFVFGAILFVILYIAYIF